MTTENENSPSRRIDDVRPAVALEWEKPAEDTVEPPARATQWTILLTSAGHGLVHAYGQPFADVKPHQQCINVVDEAVVIDLRERVRQLEAAAQPVAASAAGLEGLTRYDYVPGESGRMIIGAEEGGLYFLAADVERLLATQSAKQGAQAEPVAYLHQVICGDGEPDQALSFAPDNFPLKDTLGYRSLSYQPLYAAQVAQERAPVAEVQIKSPSPSASALDLADLASTAKEALHGLSRVEIHLEQSDAPITIKNSAVDVRLCIKELQAALKSTTNKSEG